MLFLSKLKISTSLLVLSSTLLTTHAYEKDQAEDEKGAFYNSILEMDQGKEPSSKKQRVQPEPETHAYRHTPIKNPSFPTSTNALSEMEDLLSPLLELDDEIIAELLKEGDGEKSVSGTPQSSSKKRKLEEADISSNIPYQLGMENPSSEKESFKDEIICLRRDSARSNSLAKAKLSTYYYEGIPNHEDFMEDRNLLENMAMKDNNAYAQCALLLYGFSGMTKDVLNNVAPHLDAWLKKHSHEKKALIYRGLYYFVSEPHLKEAGIAIITQAAQEKNTLALQILSELYGTKLIPIPSLEAAYFIHKEALLNGYKAAQEFILHILGRETNLGKDEYSYFLNLIEEEATNGNPHALAAKARYLEYTHQDPRNILQLYYKAIQSLHSPSKSAVVKILANADGLDLEDYEHNKQLLLEHAERKDPNAYVGLGILETRKKNFTIAYRILEDAIKAGHGRANALFIEALAADPFMPTSLLKLNHDLILQLAENQLPAALFLRGKIYEGAISKKNNFSLAFADYLKAYNAGLAQAETCLISCYNKSTDLTREDLDPILPSVLAKSAGGDLQARFAISIYHLNAYASGEQKNHILLKNIIELVSKEIGQSPEGTDLAIKTMRLASYHYCMVEDIFKLHKQLIIKRAEQNYAEAMILVSYAHLAKWMNYKNRLRIAEELLEKAAEELYHPPARQILGRYYYEGLYFPHNIARSIQLGYIPALLSLAETALQQGNIQEAQKFFYQASQEQSEQAKSRLLEICADFELPLEAQWLPLIDEKAQVGNMHALYLKSRLHEEATQSHGQPNKFMLKSATAGYSMAQYKFGLYNLENKLSDSSPEQALRWFALAAEQGHVASIIHCEAILQSGHFYESPATIHLLRNLSSQGKAYASLLLGKLYLFGSPLVPPNLENAILYLDQAYMAGSEEAMTYIIEILGTREISNADIFNKYLPHLKREADNSNAYAQSAMGYMLFNGIGGLVKNLVSAESYLKQAAQENIAKACYHYAEILMQKNSSPAEIIHYLSKAAKENVTSAASTLSKYLLESPDLKAEDFIDNYASINVAAANGDRYAGCAIALMQSYGWVLPLNLAKGFQKLMDIYTRTYCPHAAFHLYQIVQNASDPAYRALAARVITERSLTSFLLRGAKQGFVPAQKAFDKLILNSRALHHPLFHKQIYRVESNYTSYSVPTSPEEFLVFQLQQTVKENQTIADYFTLFNSIATATGEIFERATNIIPHQPPVPDGLHVRALPDPTGAAKVADYVWAYLRLQQIQSPTQPLYVNLHKVVDDTEQKKYLVPLAVGCANVDDLEWQNIKTTMTSWLSENTDQTLRQNFDKWWQHINFISSDLEKNIVRKRVKRLFTQLSTRDNMTQFTYVVSMSGAGEACNQRALRALTQLESSLLNHTDVEIESLPSRIESLFGKFKLDIVANLSKRPDHRGVVEEDRFYLVLLQNLVALPVYETSLNYPDEVFKCLKLKLALLAFYEQITPEKFVRYFHSELKKEMPLFEKTVLERRGIKLEEVPADERSSILSEVYSEFATEDLSEVRQDYIEKLLLDYGYLSPTAFYTKP